VYLYLYWCLYVYFDVLHSLHLVCRLVSRLISIFVLIFIHAVVIICVCQIFIKETASLQTKLEWSRSVSCISHFSYQVKC